MNIFFALLTAASALEIPISAVRPHGADAFELLDQLQSRSLYRLRDDMAPKLSVYRRVSESEALQVSMQTLPSLDVLNELFSRVRDRRILRSDQDFPRRPSWMYPDDGCYARAEVASQLLIQEGYRPSKIFAYGNLRVQTKNSENGFVEWWYHVVVGYRVGSINYVLDPAIDPTRPLTLKEWISKMKLESDDRVEISVCDSSAITPDSLCQGSRDYGLDYAKDLQDPFLDSEWSRLLSLKRDPKVELGMKPPWSQN